MGVGHGRDGICENMTSELMLRNAPSDTLLGHQLVLDKMGGAEYSSSWLAALQPGVCMDSAAWMSHVTEVITPRCGRRLSRVGFSRICEQLCH